MDNFWNALANLINVIATGIVFVIVVLILGDKKGKKDD